MNSDSAQANGWGRVGKIINRLWDGAHTHMLAQILLSTSTVVHRLFHAVGYSISYCL